MSDIIIVGGFAEAIELAETCGHRVLGVIDPDLHRNDLGYRVLGTDDDAKSIASQHPGVPVFLSIDDPAHRARLVGVYRSAGFAFASLIHPGAHVSRSAVVGEGAMIQYGAYVSAKVSLGEHVRLNVYANVMHDSRLGAYTTVAPNAVVLGRVSIGDRCYIGAHSTVMLNLEIGEDSVVGAHANVTKSLAPGSVVVGNPARPR